MPSRTAGSFRSSINSMLMGDDLPKKHEEEPAESLADLTMFPLLNLPEQDSWLQLQVTNCKILVGQQVSDQIFISLLSLLNVTMG